VSAHFLDGAVLHPTSRPNDVNHISEEILDSMTYWSHLSLVLNEALLASLPWLSSVSETVSVSFLRISQ
jgi:hypothetical protein